MSAHLMAPSPIGAFTSPASLVEEHQEPSSRHLGDHCWAPTGQAWNSAGSWASSWSRGRAAGLGISQGRGTNQGQTNKSRDNEPSNPLGRTRHPRTANESLQELWADLH